MKNLIIALMAILLLACSTKQDLSKHYTNYEPLKKFKGDTAAFITSILANKNHYIGKPLNTLLLDLSIPVKRFTTAGSHKDITISTDITIKFYNSTEIDRKFAKKQDPFSLIVVWEKPLDAKKTDSIALKSLYRWTPEVEAYFNRQIVGDIVKSGYNGLK